jgi:hypothetical protein
MTNDLNQQNVSVFIYDLKPLGRTSADSVVFGVIIGNGPQSNTAAGALGAGVGEASRLSDFSIAADLAEDPCLGVRCGRREEEVV